MLSIWRRHGPGCKQSSRQYRRCSCPIWIEGTAADGRYIRRRSLKTRNWTIAEKAKIKLDNAAIDPPKIGEAIRLYLVDLKRRKISASVQTKFRRMLTRLEQFAVDCGVTVVSGFRVDDAHAFAASWDYAPSTARAELERLRQFFKFAVESGWMQRNPATPVKPPRQTRRQTLPFSPEEMALIYGACKPIERAFVLLMRYSGLRIGDAARLPKDRVSPDGDLMLYTAKTGQPVRLPLPPAVMASLEQFPHRSEEYFFWDPDVTKRDSVRNYWVDRLALVFKRSGVAGAHSHRLRDTFATELLLRGVSLEEVSILLGHASVKVTEKHYAPWIEARQRRLADHVRSAWAEDPALNEASNSRTTLQSPPVTH